MNETSLAEDIIEGNMCSECGMPFEDAGQGYPRLCDDCANPEDDYEEDNEN